MPELPRRLPPSAAREEVRDFARRLLLLFVLIHAVIAAGTLGFVLTSDRGVWESLELSLDTVATVGSIPHPEETGAQIVKVVLVMTGVGTLFYALVTVTEFFVAGHIGEFLADRRNQRMVDALSDHYVICGFGRVGRQVARDLSGAGARYVIVDRNPDNRELAAAGVRFIEGDPGEDEIMRKAGIERARAVIACVDSDADNIFITLTARELRPDIEIVARASAEDSEKKLLRAGATRVISPYKSSGTEMARFALHPQVRGAFDVAPQYRMEEIAVAERCGGAGRLIGDVRGGAVIFALRSADGTFHFMPPAEYRLEPGDILMAMGTADTMDMLERLFDAPTTRVATA